MTLQIGIDVSPVYELLVSIHAFTQKQHYRSMDYGASWAAQVQKKIGDKATAFIRERASQYVESRFTALALLAHVVPVGDNTEEFLTWLGQVSTGQLADLLVPHASDQLDPFLRRWNEDKEQWLEFFRIWNEQYFRDISPEVLQAVHRSAQELEQERLTSDPETLVAKATHGLRIRGFDSQTKVRLIPQHHFAPWNVLGEWADERVIFYPVDLAPEGSGEPPKSMLRLAKALADESRMRLLHFIAEQPRTFTEIVHFSGLTKGTIHHHLVTLRAAGLVWLDNGGTGPSDTYEVNRTTIDGVSLELSNFLFGAR